MNEIFKALNDSTRREILEILRFSEMNAGDIADRFNISKPSISHHLDLLKQADLVKSKKRGQFMEYSLNISTFDFVLDWLGQFKIDPNTEKPRFRIPLSQYE
jgi:ArsR family transcriptional regulator, arsenate/arsenite/antimonite-responsive transcriptional repressor